MEGKELERHLQEALKAYNDTLDDGEPIFEAETFEDQGVLCHNPGLVISVQNDMGVQMAEYQVQIIRSR